MMRKSIFHYIEILLALLAAIIFLQTLYFKFTAHPDSVFIFEKMGLEPHGRIGIGIAELIAALLLIVPKTRFLGGALGLGVISGAVFSHLFVLGIDVQGDGGSLFMLAIITFLCCLYVTIANRKKLLALLKGSKSQ
jgi:hypothetical protein